MGKKDYTGLVVLIVITAILPLIIENEYYIGILVFTALNCLTCTGLSLLMGYAGQISMGHAAFIAVGAYTSAILTTRLAWSPWIAMTAGIFLTIITALFIGIPSLRLKGHYLAMATLGFGSIVHIVTVAAIDLTGGPNGINDIPYLSIMGFPLNSDTRFFYFSWSAVIIGIFLALNLIYSRIGRGLRAIHGSEDAAASSGINTSLYKIQVFVISAVYASISGCLYAHYVNYIDPGPFEVMHSVLLVTMVAVGGMYKIWGAFTGAVLLSLLPEFLSSASEYFELIGIQYETDYDILVYGGILLAIMLFMPEGLLDGLGKAARFPGNMIKKMKKEASPNA